ncbi:phytanoyl-CoA dioxygenase family protein [Paenibacillus cymbidii]|uniref:phytanoyl-CoA dioxygenase family protein n=1 Tax=Paenibacillus cymbidii TaxID=1639034 RepID=UPI0010807D36|nr:phytanoyl-CoA dioxygenase family protein [Paenibacillus cymbidii]
MEASTQDKVERYSVSIDEYVSYRRDGFLIARGLLSADDTNRLRAWTDGIYTGADKSLDHLHADHSWQGEKKPERLSSARLHQPHFENATAEWGLLHPRLLDVLEALIGPDVLALQSMMFFNPPGKGGQGWHQDSFYIQTQPDSLIGAWIALDRADEENGCLWVAPGSHHEPVYPPHSRGHFVHATETVIDGLFTVENASHMNDEINNLSPVAAKYGPAVPVVLEPGDVLFFHSHLLHRSYANRTADRYRRSYVTHYCNARSWVPWGGTNERQVLARGRTHLPFSLPKFGTPVILSPAKESGEDGGAMMVAMPQGDMGKMEM